MIASLSATVTLLLTATAVIASVFAIHFEHQQNRALEAERLAKQRLVRALDAEAQSRTRADQARLEAGRANAVINLLEEMLGSAHPDASKGADYTVRELLTEFSAKLDDQLQQQPLVEATLRHITGSVFTRLGLTDEAEPQLRAALELRQRTSGDDAFETADTLFRLAWNEYAKGEYAASTQLASRALAVYRQHADHVGTLQALWMKQLAFSPRASDCMPSHCRGGNRDHGHER